MERRVLTDGHESTSITRSVLSDGRESTARQALSDGREPTSITRQVFYIYSRQVSPRNISLTSGLVSLSVCSQLWNSVVSFCMLLGGIPYIIGDCANDN